MNDKERREQNRENSSRYWKSKRKSKYAGVCWNPTGWVARIGDVHSSNHKEQYHPLTELGEIEAGLQYLQWLREILLNGNK